MSNEKIQEQVETICAIGEPTRIRVIELLVTEGERCVSEVMTKLNLSLVVASGSLRELRRKRILVSRRDGRFIRYSIKPEIFKAETRSLCFAWGTITIN